MSFSFAVMICCMSFLRKRDGTTSRPLFLLHGDALQSYSSCACPFRYHHHALVTFLVLLLTFSDDRAALPLDES